MNFSLKIKLSEKFNIVQTNVQFKTENDFFIIHPNVERETETAIFSVFFITCNS